MISDPLRAPGTDVEPVGYSTTPLDVFVLAAAVIAGVGALVLFIAWVVRRG